MLGRILQIALILTLSLYLADLSLKATQRHAHDLYLALQPVVKGH